MPCFVLVSATVCCMQSAVHGCRRSRSWRIVRAGWNDTGGWWLCKNSWGSDGSWGLPGGIFRIAYGSAYVAPPDYTYALTFSWSNQSAAALERIRANAAPDTEFAGCFLFTPPAPTRLLFVAEELWLAWQVAVPQIPGLPAPDGPQDILQDLILANGEPEGSKEGEESVLTALSKPGQAFRVCDKTAGA